MFSRKQGIWKFKQIKSCIAVFCVFIILWKMGLAVFINVISLSNKHFVLKEKVAFL